MSNKTTVGKQPSRLLNNSNTARVMIVDTSSSTPQFCDTLCSSLVEFLVLHSCLPGAPKIQYFSLYAIGNSFNCVCPLLHTRIDFQKIRSSLHDIVSSNQTSKDSTGKEFFEDNLSSVIFESITQLQRIRTSSNSKNSSAASQLDIFFVTDQQSSLVEKTICRIIKEHKIDAIKKVQIVRVNCSERDVHNSQDSSGSSESGLTDLVWGYIESVNIENNKLNFDQYFRKWLQDNGTDDVHLSVQFKDFSLKCDLVDTIIDPINISAAQNFCLETEVTFRMSLPPSVRNRQKSSINIYTLIPQNLVRIAGICESVLYGIPLIVKPTNCWKLDWEELEKNQGYFQSVNSYLSEKGLGVLLSTQEPSLIRSYFLFLPSSGSSMLIKSIATQDILMPRDACSNSALFARNDEIYSEVCENMEKISVTDEYNPFQYSCNLFHQNNNRQPHQKTESKGQETTLTSKDLTKHHDKKSVIPSSYLNEQSKLTYQQKVDFNCEEKNRKKAQGECNGRKTSPWHASDEEKISTMNSCWNHMKKKKPRFEPPRVFNKKL